VQLLRLLGCGATMRALPLMAAFACTAWLASAGASAQSAAKPPSPSTAPPPSAAEPVARLSQLMAAFSRMPGLEARFVEEKRIGMLARPLTSSGRLYFARPGLLLRRVEQPQQSEVIITPD